MRTSALPPRDAIEAQIREHLMELAALRGPTVPADSRQARALLKAWQVQRLARTHQGLLDSPRYGPAARFFLEDLYGPKDHRARDYDLARVLPKLFKLLPPAALWTLAQALRMDALSESLDADLTHALQQSGALRQPDDMDEAAYVAAYRVCGRQADRQTQLELVLSIGLSLDHLTRLPLLAGSLKLMRKPAELAGLAELHRFLERGFTAFAQMKGADEFLNQIVQAERALMLSWLQPR